MAFLKRFLFWVITSLVLLFGVAAILFLTIDKTIRIEPVTIKEEFKVQGTGRSRYSEPHLRRLGLIRLEGRPRHFSWAKV